MLEKKNKKRQPEDLTKKYPVDEILNLAKSTSLNEICKKYSISKSVVAKIIKRYGSDSLKERVSNRHPHKRKQLENNSQVTSLEDQMGNIKETLTLLQTPTLTLSNNQKKIIFYIEKIEGVINNGDEVITQILRDLSEKNIDPEKIEALEQTLKEYMLFKLQAIRQLILAYMVQVKVQEKYIDLEVVSGELQDVKSLIIIFFDSFNLLDAKHYRKVKQFILEAAPPTGSYFYNFEQSYRDYRDKILNENKLEVDEPLLDIQVD